MQSNDSIPKENKILAKDSKIDVFSDIELVTFIKLGDAQAFRQLYLRYADILWTVVYRLLKHHDDAKDVLQDFFISFWDSRESLEISTSVKGYLITSIKYKAISHLRKNIKRMGLVRYVGEFEPLNLELGSLSTHNAMEVIEMNNLIEAEVHKLPQRVKEIYLINRDSELSQKEIGEQLGLSHQVVRNKVSFALKTLRYRLKDQILIFILILIRYFL